MMRWDVLVALSLPGALALGGAAPPEAAGRPLQRKGGEGSARCHIQCRVEENGARANGTLRLLNGDREVTRRSCDGRPVEVPPGTYRAVLRLDGALDEPEREREVTVEAGKSARVEANFATGVLEIRVESGGRRTAGIAHVHREDQRIGTVSSGVSAHLSTGSYNIVVNYRGRERRFEGVALAAGERRVVQAEFE